MAIVYKALMHYVTYQCIIVPDVPMELLTDL